MRDMHKWKDKVEFSLDNRQIFFLFFGLSVVGCFVFALGIMTGRRVQWEPEAQAGLIADSFSLFDPDEQFEFKEGILESTADEIPATRDPAAPPRNEEEVKAEKKALASAAAEAANVEQSAKKRANANAELARLEAQKRAAEQKVALTMAEADEKAGETPKKKLYTLQMKAFSRAEDAETLADRLRSNGHDVRVEKTVVRGREWHRVRLGVFDAWDAAVTAKDDFEKAEHVIAYAVSL
jgi:cell division protein FtsN